MTVSNVKGEVRITNAFWG